MKPPPAHAAPGVGAETQQERRYLGWSLPRKEDTRLLTGRARFVADMTLPRMGHVALVRSPFPHAAIESIDVAAVRDAPGVIAVYTGRDLEGRVGSFPEAAVREISPVLREQIELLVKECPMPVLATDRVLWVGQPVVAVVALERALAEDAVEGARVEYAPLPVVTDARSGLADDAPVLHPSLGDNVHSRFTVEAGAVDAAFERAPHRLAVEFQLGRQVSNAVEPRGVLSAPDGEEGLLVWITNNKPYLVRSFVSEMLGIPSDLVRVLGPDMGGSFGGGIYPEDVLTPFLALDLQRPVRWIADRQENLLMTSHGRDQLHRVEVAYDDDGLILGLRDHFLMDCGAFNTYAITVPYNTLTHVRSQYAIDHLRVEYTGVLTNRAPATPVRGAGRPEASFVMERLVDLVARERGADPVDVRLRNLIPADRMPYDMGIPYRDGVRMKYDVGDFPAQLEAALELFDHEGWRDRQRRAASEGRRIGIGIASFVEGSGHGPFEGATVRVDETGHVVVLSGARPHGQGHETTLSQIAADELGVRAEDVTVRAADTGLMPHGRGSYASRTAVVAGSAVAVAASKLRDRILKVAGELLEADAADLEIRRGRVAPRGTTEPSVDFRAIARAAAPGPRSRVPEASGPGLSEEHYFVPATATFGSGTHVVAVEVDVETGHVSMLDYVTVDECGRMINPTIVEGQVHGGVAHGIGNALLEEVVYDSSGQPHGTTFMDYLLPTAADVPRVRVGHQEYPSSLNPLGVKGVGEGGAVASPAAVVNAIEDALSPLPVRLTRIPVTPERLRREIERAQVSGAR